MVDSFMLALILWAVVAAVFLGALYLVIRAAVLSALQRHELWRADGSFEVELERHRQRASRD